MPNDLALDPVRLARLATGAVLVRLPHAVVEVTGPGAVQCLQGLLTNDLVTPGPDAFHWGALLTAKGMIETDLWSLRGGDDVLLLLPPAGAAKALPVLARSIPPRLAKVHDHATDWGVLILIGSQGESALRDSALLRDLPVAGKLAHGEGRLLVARADAKAPFAFLLAGPLGEIEIATQRLTGAGAALGNEDDAEAARVLAGWPALGAEIDERTLPQEVRFDDLGGVSYTKGCYLGQETVARIHFRGHPNRELRGLEWDDGAPLVGLAIEGAGREVGTVRSTLVIGGRRIGLAPIRREVAAGEMVVAGGRPARVVTLPFQEALVAVIFLTGATGMVGRQVAELLLARGTPVAALVRDPSRASWLTELGARLVIGEADTAVTWDRVDGVEGIVHCAAVIRGARRWQSYAGANITATTLAARRARVLGIPLVHLSSVAVYGGASTAPAGTVTEEFPFQALARGNWYGRSKREAEAAVWREAERGLRAIALRPCVIYGPHDRYFFPAILRKARTGRLPLIGAGDRPMALVHARSVAEAVRAALDAKSGWGRSYNVTGDAPIAPRDFVAAIARGTGRPIRERHLPERPMLALARSVDLLTGLLPGGLNPGSLTTIFSYWCGGDPYRSDAIRRVLGWAPTIDHGTEIERLARQ